MVIKSEEKRERRKRVAAEATERSIRPRPGRNFSEPIQVEASREQRRAAKREEGTLHDDGSRTGSLREIRRKEGKK